MYTLAKPLPSEPLTVKSWKTWEPGVSPPLLAVEIVSQECAKDYADTVLERYEELGVGELVRYDPGHGASRRRELFAHFVRDDQGKLAQRFVFGERVYVECHDLWLVRHTGDLLRIAVGRDATTLWPTRREIIEAAEAGRQAAEAGRQAAEAARHQADERVAAVEAELAVLRARLAALGS